MSNQTVSANGVQFAYVEEGTGPLVLMLHGFPDTWHTWDAIRPEVAKAGYRVVTPNTRGYAPTSIPAARSSGPSGQADGTHAPGEMPG